MHEHSLGSGGSAAPPHRYEVVAATAEQRRAFIEHTSSLWKGGASQDGYLKREDAAQDLLGDMLSFWILVDASRGDPTGPGAILAGCETSHRTMFLSRGGRVEEVGVECLTSVYTPPEHRGKGYASVMLRLFASRSAAGGTGEFPNGTGRVPRVSVLYSDIGPSFYNKLGWTTHASTDLKFPACSAPAPAKDLPSVRLLGKDDIRGLLKDDCAALRAQLSHTSGSQPDLRIVSHVPNEDLLSWYWLREDQMSADIFGQPVADFRGAIVEGDGYDRPGSRMWCYWSHAWYNEDSRHERKHNILYILRVVAEGPTGLVGPDQLSSGQIDDPAHYRRGMAALARAAQEEGARTNMEKVCAWNVPAVLEDGVRTITNEAVVEQKQSSIPSLMWVDDVRQDPDQPRTEVCWAPLEKLGWS